MNKTNSCCAKKKTIPTFKAYHALNANIAIAMTVPRFRCLVEFQGVIEQNVSHSPRYLINQMKNCDESMLI